MTPAERAHAVLAGELRERNQQYDTADYNHASVLGKALAFGCGWQTWAYRKYPEARLPIPDRNVNAVHTGLLWEPKIRSAYEQAGFRVDKPRVKSEKFLRIKGRLDFIIEGGPDNIPPTLVEAKTVTEFQEVTLAAMQEADELLLRGPVWLKSYLGQMLIYMDEDVYDLEHGLLHFIGRHGSYGLATTRSANQSLINAMKEAALAVEIHLEQGTEPQTRAYDPEICAFCDYRHICPVVKELPSLSIIKGNGTSEIVRLRERLTEIEAPAKEAEQIKGKLREFHALLGADLQPGQERIVLLPEEELTLKAITKKSYEVPARTEIRASYKRFAKPQVAEAA